MAPTPEITAIVPARNAARFMTQALDSVIAQSRPPEELLILVDPSSTDATLALARNYAARETGATRVRVVEQAGRGIASAWNEAIDHAAGRVLAFLSADDRWTEEKLAVQLAHMRAQPELLYTVARFRYFLEPGYRLPAGFNPALLRRDLDGRIMETLVARREAFERVGRFDTSMAVGEDVDWYARASDRGVPMALVPRVLLYKRIHDTNISADAARNMPLLMAALKRSIDRKRSADGAS